MLRIAKEELFNFPLKKIGIFGASGSIGKQALSIIKDHSNELKAEALCVNSSSDFLYEAVKEFHPRYVGINFIKDNHPLIQYCSLNNIQLFIGKDSASQIIEISNLNIALNAIVGSIGLDITLGLIGRCEILALANKESLVVGGGLVQESMNNHSTKLIPVDSEHSAIYQCMLGEKTDNLQKVYLTGSGGPFLTRNLKTFNSITVEEAVNHPNWSMGQKISVDSATMMNKALEWIEAIRIFQIKPDQIEIIIHPESIIHSMVEFVDGSYKAQLGSPDMRVAIQYALLGGERKNSSFPRLSFTEQLSYNFFPVDYNRFPILFLVKQWEKEGGNRIPIMSIANDIVVGQFLKREIRFVDIIPKIEKTVEKFANNSSLTKEELAKLTSQIQHYLGV